MDPTIDIIEECTIPKFDKRTIWEIPQCGLPGLMSVVQEFKDLFSTSPGVTSEAYHYIWKSSVNSTLANSSTLSCEYQRIDLTCAQ